MDQSQTETKNEGGQLADLGLGQIDPKEALATVSQFARENPHVALGGAFVVGFLLGGGLTPRILGAAGMMVARRYFASTVRETLDNVVREQMGGQRDESMGMT